MQDKIEKIGKSIVHHGKINNRIYILKLHSEDFPEILSGLEELAEKEDYTKIFAKIPPNFLPWFISNNYQIEAFIPGFFKNKTDCIFVSKFLDNNRKEQNRNELEDFYQLLRAMLTDMELNTLFLWLKNAVLIILLFLTAMRQNFFIK